MSQPVLFPFIGTAIEAIALAALGVALLIQLPRVTQGLRAASSRWRGGSPRAPIR